MLFAARCLSAAVAPDSGRPAPEFALPAFSGPNVRLSEYRGDVVALSFWSSRYWVFYAGEKDAPTR